MRLPVVQLRSDQLQPTPRDAIGLALARTDRASSLELAKGLQIRIGKQPAFTGNEFQIGDLPAGVTDRFDPSALCQQVQDALFSA